MSFYGNIIYKIDKFWRKIKVGSTNIEASENDTITFAGEKGVSVSASSGTKTITISGENLVKDVGLSGNYNNNNYETVQTLTLTKTKGSGTNSTDSVAIKIPKLAISEANNTTDNALKYTITYGGKQAGIINIPLDLILDSSEVVEKNAEFTGDDGEKHRAGTYLHLTFKSTEKTIHNYINVTDLNEIAGAVSPTIEVKVENNQITADVNSGSITWDKLNNEVRYFSTDITTVNAFGGIPANTDLNGKTTHEILDMLLFPYVDPIVGNAVATPNGGIYEKGGTKTITQVSINVTKKSKPITSVDLYNGSTLIEGQTGGTAQNGGTITFSGLNVVVPTDGNQLTVKVTYPDANGAAKTIEKKTTALTFVYPYYYGVCAEGSTINATLIKGLTKKVETKSNKTDWSFTGDNKCMVFAYPKAYDVLKQIVDQNGFDITNSFERTEIPITGLDGTSQNYYVYVSNASTVSDFKVDFKY